MHKNLYERIVELCEEKDISQRQLQRDLGIANGTITKWCKATPRINTLQKVADYFGVTTEYLTGRTEYRNNEHMLQSFDANADMDKILDNSSIPYEYYIQTKDEGIIPKYIDPETRELAETIMADEQLRRMMTYLQHMSKTKVDALYNMMQAMDNEE